MSNLRPQTPKISSRPRAVPAATPAMPSNPRSPPLTSATHHNSFPTQPYAFLNESPGSSAHYILPKEGSSKLRVKASTTPEARTRLMKPHPITPRAPPRLAREMTPSDSYESLRAGPGPTAPAHSHLLPSSLVAVGGQPYEEEQNGRTESVMVTVRVRPPNNLELQRDAQSIWSTAWDEPQILRLGSARDGSRDAREWTYDRILDSSCNNSQAYLTSARAHVQSAMEGFNAVVFAYGQTASGKTFTLTGSPSNPGIIPLAISDVFAQIRASPDREFLLRASYLELYNESIIDLLSPTVGKELSLSEGKKKGEIVINGLTEMAVRTEEEVKRLLKIGEDRRKVGGTDWNERSSRSHCVFRVVIESRARSLTGPTESAGSRTPGGKLKSAGDKMTRISTLSIIDLAGSEKHTSSKERNAEGKHINQSLLTLKLVISKLADAAMGKQVTHVPYRDSKLTRLLQPSLSGDALISVICTISPSELNKPESLSTLSFASGLKKVVLRAQRKELVDPQALIQQYQNEIAELRALLIEKEQSGHAGKSRKGEDEAMEKRLEELKSLILTSNNVPSSSDTREARPLSPTKLTYPKLNYDRTTSELQENLHAAQLRIVEQDEEIARLKAELAIRPLNPDAKIKEMQSDIELYKAIMEDHERHLAEPSRKVREDVEKEYLPQISKLESALESKRIWAIRLDENIRVVTAENKELKTRCQDAEAKIELIAEWLNAFSSPDADALHSSTTATASAPGGMVIPTVVVNDFSPNLGGHISQMDLASFSEKFGTLTMKGRGGGGLGATKGFRGKMIKEESRFDLAGVGEDDSF